MKTKYSSQDKARFWNALSQYRKALESGSARDIIEWSLRIHALSGLVPRQLRSHVGRTFKDTKRLVPVTP